MREQKPSLVYDDPKKLEQLRQQETGRETYMKPWRETRIRETEECKERENEIVSWYDNDRNEDTRFDECGDDQIKILRFTLVVGWVSLVRYNQSALCTTKHETL